MEDEVDYSLPVFTPSGDGLLEDLWTIKEQEMVASAWWKSQFQKYLGLVTDRITIDGVDCYTTDIRIGRLSCSSDGNYTVYEAKLAGGKLNVQQTIDTMKLISNGSFIITINSRIQTVVGLDFTSVTTLQEIADVINNELVDAKAYINIVEQTLTKYCIDTLQICYDVNGETETYTSNVYNIDIKTDEIGVNTNILWFNQSAVGTFIGQKLKLDYYSAVATNGYSTGNSIETENMRSFLETIGYDDNTMEQLCKDANNEGVEDIAFKWTTEFEFENKDFEFIYNMIKNDLEIVSTIEVYNDCLTCNLNEISRPFQPAVIHELYDGLGEYKSEPTYESGLVYNQNTTDYDIVDVMNIEDELKPTRNTGENFSYSSKLNFQSNKIIFKDANGVDITSNYDEYLLQAVKAIMYINGNKLCTFVGAKISNEYEFATTFVKVITKETYTMPTKDAFVDSVAEYRTNSNGSLYSSEYSSFYWMYRTAFYTHQESDLKSGLFVYGIRKLGDLDGNLYMSVEGLKKASPNELLKALSMYADLEVIQSGSCGGFFSCMFDSFIKLFSAVLSITSGIVWETPIAKESTQLLMYVANGKKWVDNKNEFVSSLNIMSATALSIFITIISGGTATPAAKAFMYAMIAYNAYGGYTNMQDLRASIEYKEALDRLEDEEQKLIEEAVDFQIAKEIEESETTENKFMPLDNMMERTKYDKFGKNSKFEINYKGETWQAK